jgi:hypothetical protein
MSNHSDKVCPYKVKSEQQDSENIQESVHTNEDKFFSILPTTTLNLFILVAGNPERTAYNPDLLGEGVKIEQGSNMLNQIFNLFARYVQKVHSDKFIRKCLRYTPGRSYLDDIGPDDIAYIVSITKNSQDIWDQDLRKQELGAQAIGSQEKKLKPLFTNGSGQKRTQGKCLWNLEGMEYYHRVETKSRQIYDSKKDMTVLYNGWERWITTM